MELSYPETPAVLPLITVSETGNSALVVLSGKDRYSVITLQLDVYDRAVQDVQELAAGANDRLAAKGIKRSFSALITDERYPRVCMRFRFGLDEETGRVFAV